MLQEQKDEIIIEKNDSSEIRRWFFRVLLFLYDGFVINFAFFMAIIIRFYINSQFYDSGAKYMHMFWEFTPVYTGCCLVVFLLFRLYSSVWRYVGVNDIRKLILANACTCILQIGGSLLIVGRMPISYYGMGAFMQFFLMCVPRLAPRFILESFSAATTGGRQQLESVPMMIVGVGENARIIHNMSMKDRTGLVRPVCVVDYAGGFGSGSFNGLPVVSGKDGMQEAIGKYGIKCMILADDHLSETAIDQIHQFCDKQDIELRSFSMKAEFQSGGLRLRDLLAMTEGTVRIVNEGQGELFDNGEAALEKYRNNFAVERVSYEKDSIRVDVRRIRAAQISQDEDWVKKIKEENGGEVSFFV